MRLTWKIMASSDSEFPETLNRCMNRFSQTYWFVPPLLDPFQEVGLTWKIIADSDLASPKTLKSMYESFQLNTLNDHNFFSPIFDTPSKNAPTGMKNDKKRLAVGLKCSWDMWESISSKKSFSIKIDFSTYFCIFLKNLFFTLRYGFSDHFTHIMSHWREVCDSDSNRMWKLIRTEGEGCNFTRDSIIDF